MKKRPTAQDVANMQLNVFSKPKRLKRINDQLTNNQTVPAKVDTPQWNNDGCIIVSVSPMGAPRMTHRDNKKNTRFLGKRPVVVRYHQFKDELRNQTTGSDILRMRELYVVFLIPQPKSWSKKKKQSLLGAPHLQRPDTDNIVKAVKDTLYKEDSHIYKECAAKFWTTTNEGCILFFKDLLSWVMWIERSTNEL